jgi:Putative DNA-binding domain
VLSLYELQKTFADALFESAKGIPEEVIVSDAFPASRRLRIYHNNVFTSLTEALRHIYPVVVRLVGESFFAYAAHHYIGQYPSRSGNLHDFGEYLPQFLAELPPATGLPYLPDMARLEWARHQAFHGAEHPPLALERLAAVPTERYGDIKFVLHPSVRLIRSPFPILLIWEVNQPDHRGEATVHLDSGGGQWRVMRRTLRVEMLALSAGEFALLSGFDGGTPFASACESALAVEPTLNVTRCLQELVLAQTVVDFKL